MDRGYQHNLKEKMLSEINKTHRNWKSALLKQNSKEKRNVSANQPLLKNKPFNGKVESHTKPTTTLPTFYKTTYYFSQKRKIMAKNMLVGAKILKVNLRRHKLSMRVISCGFILVILKMTVQVEPQI